MTWPGPQGHPTDWTKPAEFITEKPDRVHRRYEAGELWREWENWAPSGRRLYRELLERIKPPRSTLTMEERISKHLRQRHKWELGWSTATYAVFDYPDYPNDYSHAALNDFCDDVNAVWTQIFKYQHKDMLADLEKLRHKQKQDQQLKLEADQRAQAPVVAEVFTDCLKAAIAPARKNQVNKSDPITLRISKNDGVYLNGVRVTGGAKTNVSILCRSDMLTTLSKNGKSPQKMGEPSVTENLKLAANVEYRFEGNPASDNPDVVPDYDQPVTVYEQLIESENTLTLMLTDDYSRTENYNALRIVPEHFEKLHCHYFTERPMTTDQIRKRGKQALQRRRPLKRTPFPLPPTVSVGLVQDLAAYDTITIRLCAEQNLLIVRDADFEYRIKIEGATYHD